MDRTKWVLIWQDELDGAQLDRSKWAFDIGYTGESNAELEVYTDRWENLRLENSLLIIEAREEQYQSSAYPSARLKTQGLHSWTYGRVEARIKIPYGQGLWPAFWMLGDDVSTVGWPECGEIDIMENIGKMPAAVRGTLHGPGYCRDDGIYSDFILADGKFADDHLVPLLAALHHLWNDSGVLVLAVSVWNGWLVIAYVWPFLIIGLVAYGLLALMEG